MCTPRCASTAYSSTSHHRQLAFVNCGRLVAAADVLRQSNCYTTETSAGPASAHSSDCASCCFYARRTELFLNCCKPDLADWPRCLLTMLREHSYSHRTQSTLFCCPEKKKITVPGALFVVLHAQPRTLGSLKFFSTPDFFCSHKIVCRQHVLA